jgi:arginine exporter protein ArgO
MNVEFINPFINALINVIDVMGHTELTYEKPKIKKMMFQWGMFQGSLVWWDRKLRGLYLLHSKNH